MLLSKVINRNAIPTFVPRRNRNAIFRPTMYLCNIYDKECFGASDSKLLEQIEVFQVSNP